MSEQISSKLYTFEDQEGKTKEHRVSESKLIFADKKGELLPGCIYRPYDFAKFLNEGAKYPMEYIFFRTTEISDKNGVQSDIIIESLSKGVLVVKFNKKKSYIRFSNINDTLEIVNFLLDGRLEGHGLGHDIMSLIKQHSKYKITLKSIESENFYLKEGFIPNDVQEDVGLTLMEWTPKTDITPELRKAVNNEARKLRESLTA